MAYTKEQTPHAVFVRLTVEEFAILCRAAQETGLSRSAVVRRLIALMEVVDVDPIRLAECREPVGVGG